MNSLILLGNTGAEAFCPTAAPILQFVGWVLLFFRIAIPLVIIGYGMFDFGKAVVASKDDEIKNAFKQLIRRAIAGIIIFFIPVVVMWFFGAFYEFNADSEAASFDVCNACVRWPGGGQCTSAVSAQRANQSGNRQ